MNLVVFLPDVVPLNWETSNFEMTVLEGFYDLSKFLETSTRHMNKDIKYQFSESSVIGAQRNHLSKSSRQFLPRSTLTYKKHFRQFSAAQTTSGSTEAKSPAVWGLRENVLNCSKGPSLKV